MNRKILNIKIASEMLNEKVSKEFFHKKASSLKSEITRRLGEAFNFDCVILNKIMNDLIDHGELIEESPEKKEEIKRKALTIISLIENSSAEEKREFVNFFKEDRPDNDYFKKMLEEVYQSSGTGKTPSYFNEQLMMDSDQVPDQTSNINREIEVFIYYSRVFKNFFNAYYPFFSKEEVIKFETALNEFEKNRAHITATWVNNKEKAVAKIMKAACLVIKSANVTDKNAIRNHMASVKFAPVSLKDLWKKFTDSAPKMYRNLGAKGILAKINSLK